MHPSMRDRVDLSTEKVAMHVSTMTLSHSERPKHHTCPHASADCPDTSRSHPTTTRSGSTDLSLRRHTLLGS